MVSSLSAQTCIVVVGKESVGKSQLIASLTHKSAYSSNFRGTTVSCETYRDGEHIFVDTPGILRFSDTQTTASVLKRLQASDRVLLVVQATHLDDDLADLLPLVRGKQGAVVVTFWDKVSTERATEALERLKVLLGLAFVPVDARKLGTLERIGILEAIDNPQPFTQDAILEKVGWRIEPSPTLLEHPYWGFLFAIVLLLFPAILAVGSANTFAEWIDPLVQGWVKPSVEFRSQLSSPLSDILVGRYGIVTMGPLLFVWAVPTVVLYALFLGAYKASGLLDRITAAIHPLIRPFGLSGRDLIRVIMGFGCNVPAVISTRACSSCSRGTCIGAIAFGSACSYQFGATLGVFAAAEMPFLVIPYLLYLTVTTLIYARLTTPKQARSPFNALVIEGRSFLEVPRLNAIWREARSTLSQFFFNAIPIFILITLIASLLDWIGILNALSSVLSPVMGLFRLPSEAALPVVLASIRKDGILLLAEPDTLDRLSPSQILTGVYLAGVLLPCLVTLLMISREVSWRFAFKLLCQQVTAAIAFALLLAWGSWFFLA
ncbi:ferrous iron transporter B [Candidatus Gracilibacteria bacterium]|nr:ferrous iron transporter B [Candidatus Gracilibacteria bacterium]NJM89565.1 ferrous iron transporter B [Hydrococcus sp. RU_2_2]NJP19784.1 ferrous iron transporter B [Hydrococcus sp. CRU_1_1]